MKGLRKIVREELARAISQLIESNAFTQDSEQILYNFETGRAFGVNKLARDVDGLEAYYMSSYFPNSEMKENWMFEIDTNYGGSQLVEIIHQIGQDYKSYWKMNVAELDKDSNQPTIIATSGVVEGYENFIQKVNSTLGKTINPGFL